MSLIGAFLTAAAGVLTRKPLTNADVEESRAIGRLKAELRVARAAGERLAQLNAAQANSLASLMADNVALIRQRDWRAAQGPEDQALQAQNRTPQGLGQQAIQDRSLITPFGLLTGDCNCVPARHDMLAPRR